MSTDKPEVIANTCEPDRIPVKQKARRAKPKTEWVLQMGPFTDGQITTPDTHSNVSGPFHVVFDPQTGEARPFDPDEKPAKNVVRKYITVEAQDTDVPDDLVSAGTPTLNEDTPSELLPFEAQPQGNEMTKVSYVREQYNTATVQC
ncbi:MAG: hypothetical protein R3194_14735, partial [Limnobacter sp.]|nr:hypothetical protein [Limnobacter sp.]